MAHNRKINLHHFEEQYFTRMASSLGDKSKLLKFLPVITDPSNPPRVLDVGAGGGEFAHILHQLGYNVTALDASEEAVNRIEYKYPELNVIHALANETHLFGVGEYDAIICSSILHEVFSYGDTVHKAGHYSSIVRALNSFQRALKPGGVLLIRDGVKPDDWATSGVFRMLNDADNRLVVKYLTDCPFANGGVNTDTGRLVSLTFDETTRFWSGNYQSIMEFAYTFTWGEKSYPRETQELYGVYTLQEYVEVLDQAGFNVEHAEAYLQPGYPEHLGKQISFSRDKGWFNSNAIWVARKSE